MTHYVFKGRGGTYCRYSEPKRKNVYADLYHCKHSALMNAIAQGIITPSTKDTLIKLEEEEATFELSIAKEKN